MNSIFPLFFLNILIVQAFTDGKRYKRGVYDLIPQDRLGMRYDESTYSQGTWFYHFLKNPALGF